MSRRHKDICLKEVWFENCHSTYNTHVWKPGKLRRIYDVWRNFEYDLWICKNIQQLE